MKTGELVIKNGDSQAYADGTSPGLTKREYFAAICLGHAVDKWYNHSDEELVGRSIKLADEFLKQLDH